jgi:hypothetical protein
MSSSPSTSFSQTALCSRLTARVNPSPGPLGNVRTFNYKNNKLLDHKTHIYLEYHSICPLVEIVPPSPASECAPPTESKGGDTLACGERGAGSPNSDDWRESLVICLLCVLDCRGHEIQT